MSFLVDFASVGVVEAGVLHDHVAGGGHEVIERKGTQHVVSGPEAKLLRDTHQFVGMCLELLGFLGEESR